MTSCVCIYIYTYNASTPFREWESEHTCVLQSARVPVCLTWRRCPHLCNLVQRTSASEAGFSGWCAGSQRRATSRTASHSFRNRVQRVACGFTAARHLTHRLPLELECRQLKLLPELDRGVRCHEVALCTRAHDVYRLSPCNSCSPRRARRLVSSHRSL